MIKRAVPVLLASLALALLLPAVSPATLAEVGVIPATTPPTVPSCPGSPCLAVSRTTGFQLKVGKQTKLSFAPRNGSIVAWGDNYEGQTNIPAGLPYAVAVAGGDSHGLAVVSDGSPFLSRQPAGQVLYSGLTAYFSAQAGKTAQFPLDRTIQARKGDIIALTVPTWAPALALGFGKDTSWRASRERKQCSSTSAQSTHTQIGSSVQYFCLYQTARLTYGATLISTP